MLTALALSASTSAFAAAPDDIQRIDDLAGLIEGGSRDKTVPEEDYYDAFSKLVLKNVGAILNENGLPASLSRLDGDSLRRRIANEVEGKVGAALALKGSARREALYAALTHFSMRAVAEDIASGWLGAKAMGEYADESVKALDKEARKADRAAKDAADTARGDRPLTTAERIAARAEELLKEARSSDEVRSARLAERFRRQVQVAPSSGDLRVKTSDVKLVSDEGGPGAKNGVADAGEWVKFTVPIENTGRESWYSASVWVRSRSDCAWTGDAREVELPELAPKDLASVEIQAYISETCPDGTRVPFIVEIRDSARAATTPVTFDVGVVATNVGKPTLRDLRIDTDVPGSSDGSANPMLAKGRDLELSAGIKLPKPGALSAVQGWGVSDDLTPVVLEASYRFGDAMGPADAGGGFTPSDDMDVAANAAAAFADGAASVAARRGWSTPADAGGVAVVEARVSYSGSEGAWAPVANATIPVAPPAAPPPPPTPSAAETLKMLRDAITVEAREVDAKGDALASVTSTIFDAHVDEEAFTLNWCHATKPVVPGKADPCDPDAKVDPPAEPQPINVALPAFTDPAEYTFRSYVWVPMVWEGEPAKPVEPTPPPVQERRLEPAPEPEPKREPAVHDGRKPSLLGISAGFEVGSVTLLDDKSANFLTSYTAKTEPQLWIDVSLGKQGPRAHVDAAASLGLSSVLVNDQTMSASRIGAGGGYAIRLLHRWVEVEPDLYLGVRFVSIKGDFGNRNGSSGEASITSGYIEPAVSFRWFPIQMLSVGTTLSYRAQLGDGHAGPVTVDVANTSGVKFKLGVGLHF